MEPSATATHASRFTLHVSRLLVVLVLLLAASVPASAQTAQQLELLRQNPDLVRQRIQSSGLSPEQIRSRLEAAGYPRTMLDAYMSEQAGAVPAQEVSPDLWRALGDVGISLAEAEGLEPVPLLAGAQPSRFDTLGVAADTILQVFGLNAFRARTTQYQPVLSGPVPPSYRLGPGDVLVLVLTGDVELVHELTVTREGFIVIPQVGQIFVNSLTMEQLDQLLRRRLGQSYSGIRTGTTKFDVTVTRLRTNQIYVSGEVLQPGAYQLASVATILNALYAAGGPTMRGNLRDIVVKRGSETVAEFDLYDYLLRGSVGSDVILEQGDNVFVPIRGPRVSASGAVIRPAIYELGPGETLADLVRMAGGFRADAEQRRLTVYRILPPRERRPGPYPRAVVDVPLEIGRGEEGGRGNGVVIPALTLEDGDSVVVDSILPARNSLTVAITGMVTKPGRYPWSEGMTMRDLVLLARGPLVGADLREAEVARLPADRSEGAMARIARVPLDSTYLFERDSTGRYVGAAGLAFPAAGTAPDVPLEPYDQVTIFRQPEFELQRSVAVTGEVLFPGTYALRRKDERVADLVRRAGGLTSTAYVEGARFYRNIGDTSRVNIDLAGILATEGAPGNIVLQPGDSLFIPEYIPTVRVVGAVLNPTSVLYEEGRDVEYYIANAGGYTRNADKGRVAVQFANGSAEVKRKLLFLAHSPTPRPGSVVAVPEIPADARVDTTALLGTIAQILTSAVAIIAIVVK
jgi:polysaccharide export outer membrane protein